MTQENITLEIYLFIIHWSLNYHCILFEDENTQFILPFKREIEDLINGGR